jgi:hypothetical protein
MHRQLSLAALLCASLGAGGCSFITHFDPESLACDDAGECLLGYVCHQGRCLRADGGDACGGCADGQRCVTSIGTCVPDTCAYRRCWPGTKCVEGSGSASCVPVDPPALGHLCTDDTSCVVDGGTANRVCLHGAIQSAQNGGALRPGVCVERCSPLGTCLTAGAMCSPFPLALSAGAISLCVPPALLSPCTSNRACADDDLVCTVFDHPQVGATTLCDRRLVGGAATGAPCQLVSSDAGSLCANGLCAPRAGGANPSPTCGEPCDQGTCDAGVCRLVEFGVLGLVRYIPMCVSSPSRCAACVMGGNVCEIDAPRCSPGLPGGPYCLGACSPDAGGFPTCPSGQNCTLLDAGYRCLVPPLSTCTR